MTLDKAIYLNVVFMLPFISVNAPLLDVTVIYGAAYCMSDSVLLVSHIFWNFSLIS